MKILIYCVLCLIGVQQASAQFIQAQGFPANLKHRITLDQTIQPLGVNQINIRSFSAAMTDTVNQTSLLVELGYISAMEITFAGLSYLSGRDHWAGRSVVGGADVLMGLAGVGNAFAQDATLNQLGYFALSAGFMAKALYNFGVFGDPSLEERMKVNFIGYNILVFSGYFLDSL